ncbi:DNA photolyase, FAD-binding/Cryptochrome [Umbelopsis sp. AD052]|nr:DNA photolyase, FAD-binding/Cryptochrome [Umbelopsis sp. AD052]
MFKTTHLQTSCSNRLLQFTFFNSLDIHFVSCLIIITIRPLFKLYKKLCPLKALVMSPPIANQATDRSKKRTQSPSSLPKRRKISQNESIVDAVTKSSNGNNNMLVWFRSDLRTKDNPALAHALQKAQQQHESNPGSRKALVIALFVLSPSEFRSHDVGAVKVDFILRNLATLSETLWKSHRIPLIVKNSPSAADVIKEMHQLCSAYSVSDLFANQEYEIDESRRDAKLLKSLPNDHVEFHLLQDQCVVPPGVLKSKSSNSTYTVYSPFKRMWFDVVKKSKDKYLTLADSLSDFPAPVNSVADLESLSITHPDPIPDVLKGFELEVEKKRHLEETWPAGEVIALQNLDKFCSGKRESAGVTVYNDARNYPRLENGTSRLSPYLAVGALTTKQCIVKAMEANGGKLDTGSSGIVTWIQELIWRDFYRNVLVGFPRVCMGKPFKLETMNIQWLFEDDVFQSWCYGKTGYPIVDAGMRQLQKTGWMHNRVRMIVASFLTKHLLHNWQHGEKFFANSLIDGDFASNNGGWQWVASTGTDAQPYFRIFNPYTQSEKFDPDGIYIKRWVPELAGLKTSAAIHNPHSVLSAKELIKLGYREKPIVDHKVARERAIAAFKLVLGKGGQIPNPKSNQGYGNHDYEEKETKGGAPKTKALESYFKGKIKSES